MLSLPKFVETKIILIQISTYEYNYSILNKNSTLKKSLLKSILKPINHVHKLQSVMF